MSTGVRSRMIAAATVAFVAGGALGYTWASLRTAQAANVARIVAEHQRREDGERQAISLALTAVVAQIQALAARGRIDDVKSLVSRDADWDKVRAWLNQRVNLPKGERDRLQLLAADASALRRDGRMAYAYVRYAVHDSSAPAAGVPTPRGGDWYFALEDGTWRLAEIEGPVISVDRPGVSDTWRFY